MHITNLIGLTSGPYCTLNPDYDETYEELKVMIRYRTGFCTNWGINILKQISNY